MNYQPKGESSRFQDPENPNIYFVQRVKNSQFQHVKEVQSTTGEEISSEDANQTIETITITRTITPVTSY